MHPLVAKFIGRPAIANAHAHQKAAEKASAKYKLFSDLTAAHGADVEAARSKFVESPTTENFVHWVALESRTAAMTAIGSQFRDISAHARLAKLADGGAAILLAAVDEAEAGLKERADRIAEDDERRSLDLGVPVKSTAAFAEIERLQDTLYRARQWVTTDISQAFSALNTVLGSQE